MATELRDVSARPDRGAETREVPLPPEWVPMTAPSLDITDTAKPPGQRPVTLFVSFETDVHPGNPWLKTWVSLGSAALAKPGCRDFRILQDGQLPDQIWVVSEWQDRRSLNLFLREVHLPWIERAMAANLVPATFHVLESPERLSRNPVPGETRRLVF